jgi:hypothetical protein
MERVLSFSDVVTGDFLWYGLPWSTEALSIGGIPPGVLWLPTVHAPWGIFQSKETTLMYRTNAPATPEVDVDQLTRALRTTRP